MRHAFVLAFSALIATSCFAAQSDFKAFMKAEVPKVVRAFETKDTAFFDSISAPDFVDKSMGQTINRAQAMAEMKAQFKTVKSLKLSMKLMSVRASGNTGYAVTSGVGTFTLKPGKDGKTHVMASKFTEHETWVRSGSTWKIKVLEESMGDTTMDGKPLSSAGH